MRQQPLGGGERQQAHRAHRDRPGGGHQRIPARPAPPEPAGPQGHRRVSGGRQQCPADAERAHLAAPAAQHQDGEPGQRPGDGGRAALAEPFAQRVPRAERDQRGPGAERDDGADREAGLADGGEVGGLEESEQQAGHDQRAGRRPDPPEPGAWPAYGEHPQQHHEPARAPPERQGERTEVTGEEEERGGRSGGAPGGSGDDEVQQTAPGSGRMVRHVVLRACVKDEGSRSSLRGQRAPARELPGQGVSLEEVPPALGGGGRRKHGRRHDRHPRPSRSRGPPRPDRPRPGRWTARSAGRPAGPAGRTAR